MPKSQIEMERSSSPVKKPKRPIRQARTVSISYAPLKKKGKKQQKKATQNPKAPKSFDNPNFVEIPVNPPKAKKEERKRKEPTPQFPERDENDDGKPKMPNPNVADPNIEEEAIEMDYIC